MTVDPIRLVSLATVFAAAAALAGPAYTQVPEGSAVICTHTLPGGSYVPGNPGLFITALDGSPVTAITGLPAELTTDSGGAWGQGAISVSIRSADGAVIVSTISGPLAPTAGVVKLWVLHLVGNAVDPARTRSLVLGASAVVGVSFQTVLPDGRILVGASDNGVPFASGPLAGHFAGIVDTSGPTPTVTTLPNPVFTASSLFGGMAVAPAGDAVYFVTSDKWYGNPISTPTNAYVHRYDLATNQTCLIATLNGESAMGAVCDDDGTIYVSSTNPTSATHSIYSVVPDGCNPATVTSVPSSNLLLALGVDLDRASGRFVAGSFFPAPFAGPQFNALSLVDPTNGSVTAGVASAPAAGWGTLGRLGVAVNNVIESYGSSSDGENRHWFENFPNPGGQPTTGNLGFSLTLRSAPNPPALSLIALSLGRGSTTLAGIEILVDPGTTVTSFVQSARTATHPLAIPGSPALSGLLINAQSLHLEPNSGLTASRGLAFTVQ